MTIYQNIVGLNWPMSAVQRRAELPNGFQLRLKLGAQLDGDRRLRLQDRHQVAMYGYADPVTDLLPPSHWGHDASYLAPTYDPNKAKDLLAQAGYDANHPLSFELRIINNQDFIDQATIIQQQLQQIGVQVKVTPLDKPAFLAPMFYTKGADNLSWQAGLERYTFGADTPSIVWQTYDTGSYINFCGVNLPGGVKDSTLQNLIDQAKVETDKMKAKALFSQISTQVDKDALTVRCRRPISKVDQFSGWHLTFYVLANWRP